MVLLSRPTERTVCIYVSAVPLEPVQKLTEYDRAKLTPHVLGSPRPGSDKGSVHLANPASLMTSSSQKNKFLVNEISICKQSSQPQSPACPPPFFFQIQYVTGYIISAELRVDISDINTLLKACNNTGYFFI